MTLRSNLDDTAKSVFKENVRVKEALSSHIDEADQLRDQVRKLESENCQLRNDQELSEMLVQQKVAQSRRNKQTIKEVACPTLSCSSTIPGVISVLSAIQATIVIPVLIYFSISVSILFHILIFLFLFYSSLYLFFSSSFYSIPVSTFFYSISIPVIFFYYISVPVLCIVKRKYGLPAVELGSGTWLVSAAQCDGRLGVALSSRCP